MDHATIVLTSVAGILECGWDRERLIGVRTLLVQALELVDDVPEAAKGLQSTLDSLDAFLKSKQEGR